MKVQIVCATLEGRDAAIEKIELAFPGSSRKKESIVPSAILGGATPLKDILRRYEGAAPYGGPDPATLWTITAPVRDTDRMRELTISLCVSGELLDMEISIHREVDTVLDIQEDHLEGELHD